MKWSAPRQSGLSLLEFTLVVIIFAVLVVIAFDRIAALRVDMERAVVRHTVAAMREALALELARRAVDTASGPATDLVAGNALELLDPPPQGYRGKGPDGAWRNAPRGAWFYDPDRGLVVHRLRYPAAAPGDTPQDFAAWRVTPRDDDDTGASVDHLILERVRP